MTSHIIVVLTLLSSGVRDMVTDAGRAYVAGTRPPAVQSAQTAAGPKLSLRHLRPPCPPTPADGRDILIVGDTPAETLTITGQWTHEGDILVINDGVVEVVDAEFLLHGNLWAVDQAAVSVTNSSLTLQQRYLYQYAIFVGGAARFAMGGSTVAANRYPYGFAVMDSSVVRIDSVHYDDFTTYSLFGAPTVDIRHVNLAGEFVVMDSSRCAFADVDTALIWCSMMDGAVIDYAFPPEGPVYGWAFDCSQPGVSGIHYAVVCDSVYHPWWGMFSGAGSDVTIRDSNIRSCGIFFEGAAADTLSGLVDGMSYNDATLPLADRTLRFVNTEVTTISLYPWDFAQVHFSSCILGEVLSMDGSLAFGMQYYLDGTGGHLEASGQAGNVAALAMLTADVLARDQGFVVLASCAQLWGQNWAEDQSKLFMVQTATASLPMAFDGAVVGYEMVTDPSVAPVNGQVPIMGSVWVDCGPDATVDLAGYSVFYEPVEGTRIRIGGGTAEVRSDTLAVWNTTGLAPGTHVIVVEFCDTQGDTLEGFSLIRLEEPAGVEEAAAPSVMLDIGRSAHGVRMVVTTPQSDQVRLSVHDLAGRVVRVPLCGPVAAGTVEVCFEHVASGVYVARLTSGQGEVIMAFTIVR
ncbi:T9SS type A sorting domain-containing protein [Candidatus Fermentibacteria bacterium]|nr:T9SS type A sorting domain-containing protein [Candidatus Fermentibacteria bacterium]